jgi:AcrR family transcriptional regulator
MPKEPTTTRAGGGRGESARARRAVRRQAPAAERRAQILRAALRCFSRDGFHVATMDDLAREAGLSKGSLYWHFRSKEEVFAALCGAWSLELFAACQALAASHRGGYVALIGRVGTLSIERIAARGDLLRAWTEFIVHPAVRQRFAAIYRASREQLAGWIRAGIDAGEIRPLDPEGVAASATAAIEGLLIQQAVEPAFDAVRHWEVSWQVFARGIAA